MSDERDALLRMLKEGQRVLQSRAVKAAGIASTGASSSDAAAGGLQSERMGSGSRGHHWNGGDGVNPTLNARDNLQEFLRHYYAMFRTFAENPDHFELVLGSELSAYDRHALHDLAQACGLSHESRGPESNRVLVIRRDALFHGNAKQYERVSLEAVAEHISGKTSKFDVARHKPRRDRNAPEPRPGEVGSYADEDAARKLARFENARDEFRHATYMGYTHEEAMAMEREGGRLEDILKGGSDSAAKDVVAPSSLAKAQLRLEQREGESRAAAQDGDSTATGAVSVKGPTTYYETCKGCASRVKLEGERGKWQCLHYCARCAKQTIWVLEEGDGLVLTPRHGARADADVRGKKSDASGVALPPSTTAKRGRGANKRALGDEDQDESEAYGSQRPLRLEHSDSHSHNSSSNNGEKAEGRLSIDRSSESGSDGSDFAGDEDDDGEELTVDDVVESASINDFSDVDTNWIRAFAQRHKVDLKQHIIFCIGFADLLRAPIFRRHDGNLSAPAADSKGRTKRGCRSTDASPADHSCLYAVVRAIGISAADSGHQSVGSLIDKVVSAAYPREEEEKNEAKESVAVAFRYLPALGTEATVVCQLRDVITDGPNAVSPALEALQRELGSRHLFLTPDLEQAIAKASEEG